MRARVRGKDAGKLLFHSKARGCRRVVGGINVDPFETGQWRRSTRAIGEEHILAEVRDGGFQVKTTRDGTAMTSYPCGCTMARNDNALFVVRAVSPTNNIFFQREEYRAFPVPAD